MSEYDPAWSQFVAWCEARDFIGAPNWDAWRAGRESLRRDLEAAKASTDEWKAECLRRHDLIADLVAEQAYLRAQLTAVTTQTATEGGLREKAEKELLPTNAPRS